MSESFTESYLFAFEQWTKFKNNNQKDLIQILFEFLSKWIQRSNVKINLSLIKSCYNLRE